MSKYLKRLAMIVLTAVLSITVLTGPVFAVPPTDTPNDQDTSEQTQDGEENTTEQPTCYDEVGGIGWLICPGTSFLANVIDGAYEILESLVAVNPISTDTDAPVHVVWDYLRNISNLIFVIVFLIIIYSQLTGYGINNYGIKRMLPRLIIAAILMNLSYVICSVAVDLSNIIGFSFRNVFNEISKAAIENGTIGEAAQSFSVGGVVGAVLGIGTAAGGLVLATSLAGGFTGLIWLLIPIVLSGALAVISALITMAARQALVLLLIMVSPIAIAAYLLPNTEQWFKRWYKLLFSMLVFFPMFSILYGASNLAGLVMISSAKDWLGVVLGIAVLVLPLFMSIPLLRMSGTVLGCIDGMVHRTGAPLGGRLGRYANDRRMLARQQQLLNNSYRPSARLAQWLDRRHTARVSDMRQNESTLSEVRAANYKKDHTRRDGTLNRRGQNYYLNQARTIQARNIIEKFDIDMDEGFEDNGDARVRRADAGRVAAANSIYKKAITDSAINGSRKATVGMENLRRRANTIQEGLKEADSEISKQVAESFNYQHLTESEVNSLSAADRAAYNSRVSRATNAVLADAITAKRKADSTAKSNYLELYNDAPPGPTVVKQLEKAFDERDYNSMDAAIAVIRQRGDFNLINDVVKAKSADIADDQVMQKHLSEALLGIKGDYGMLGAYSTAIMKRRGMSSSGRNIEAFIDYDTFLRRTPLAGDVDTTAAEKVSLEFLMKSYADYNFATTQDKNTFKDILANQIDGTFSPRYMAFSDKQVITALFSGKQNGEALTNLISLITGGYSKANRSQEEIAFFNNNQAQIHDYITNTVLANMTTNNVTSGKSDVFVALNDVLTATNPAETTTINFEGNDIVVSNELRNILQNQVNALNRTNAVGQRSGMSKKVRAILGIRQD